MRDAGPVTRVIIFATATLHREAWRALLSGQPGLVVAGAAHDPAQLDGLLQRDEPTTVLIDAAAPYPDLAGRLRGAAPDCGLLFLVPAYDLADIVALLRAGATGCISRDESPGDLARGIIAAGRGEIVLPLAIAARALAALARGEPLAEPRAGPAGEALVEPLSERETEVLRLLALGLTNKDMAQKLILSVRTVEAHLRSVYSKLGVGSRTEAALWAVRHGHGPED
ncbi:MAG: response regulator transcription factor [Armatimonadetes bacterium]|nr:response regulator transcription factor [Armatimonadota bacterium]